MIEERSIRVWVDDQNPIFRIGLTACVEPPRFVLVGESSSFVPKPDLDRTDVLIFGLGQAELAEALRLREGTDARLVTIAPSGGEDLLVEAVEAGVAGALLRSDVTPQALKHCLRSVASGNGSLPAAVLGRLVGGGGRRGGPTGDLSGRELNVLRLLSKGENTRQIAEGLCYSEKTVKNIVHDLLIRMNCRNRAQAVALATRRGLI